MSDSKLRVLSGIRASGKLHIGNYYGAIKGMLELQQDDAYETFYMVADAHGITTPYEIEKIKAEKLDVILDYLAAGLDPEKSTVFIQSMVPAHYELSYFFSSVITVARMQHLPTFKEKVKQYPENATMALLNYPVLMTADILIYHASRVPVGQDQEPHLEVAREISRKFNALYGTNFPEPTVFRTKGSYVPSLTGEGKMSKSVEGSYISLRDDLETIKSVLAKVPTDSGKGEILPESGSVANLLTFVDLFMGEQAYKHYADLYTGAGIRYSDLKAELAGAIFAELQPFQQKRAELVANPTYVNKVIVEGAAKATEVANATVDDVRSRIGMGYAF
ncbi:MAG: tryptophan--tRNA ligase [Patescibacteria group bacterium]